MRYVRDARINQDAFAHGKAFVLQPYAFYRLLGQIQPVSIHPCDTSHAIRNEAARQTDAKGRGQAKSEIDELRVAFDCSAWRRLSHTLFS